MTDAQYAHLLSLVWYIVGGVIITMAVETGNLILKVVLYNRTMVVQEECLDILRLSREFQGMARQQKEHSSQVLSEVTQTAKEAKEAVKELKQTVTDGGASDSGLRLKTLPPQAGPA